MPVRRARRSRNSKNFVAIPVDGFLTVGALADGVVVDTSVIGTNFTEDIFVVSTDLSATLTGLTADQGIPSEVILSHGDYTVGEVAEALDVALTGPGSKIEEERSRRLIRKVGVLNQPTPDGTELAMIGKYGSRIIRTKVKFTIQNDKALRIGLKNRSGATLTTGSLLRFSGYIYGRWLV